ncbi:glutathione transferase GstA [Legionella worsleiensis]|uniref:Glutathione S-transferase n=1 Tax=Legionella worsleiensis TaxID=45076 RepID=A0A0W1A638_9GAMM|nr:glutathione transferase GstA [Legionella worsleiensis]KTD76811.1 glutathione S-transferase [Legionella worsleiensis]STY30665.1 glutathione S-transferase [Legionella worsleiensis]
MKLYYYKGACSLVVRIIMNELGIKFQDEEVDLWAKKTASGTNFLDINPKGAVPALVLDNGDVMTESQVILQYLTDITSGHELLAPVGNLKRYHTLEWLNYVSTELHKTLGMFFVPMVTEEIKEKLLIPLAMYKLGYVEKHLSHNTYLMGDYYSLPDAYLYVVLRWARSFTLDFTLYPNLLKYMELIQNRAAVTLSLKQEGF